MVKVERMPAGLLAEYGGETGEETGPEGEYGGGTIDPEALLV